MFDPDFIVSAGQVSQLEGLRAVVTRKHVLEGLSKYKCSLEKDTIQQLILYVHVAGFWRAYDLTPYWNDGRNTEIWHDLRNDSVQFDAIGPDHQTTIRFLMKFPSGKP